MVGALSGGYFADSFGRTRSISIAMVPMGLGFLLMNFTSSFDVLITGRALTGFGVGLVTVAVPVYIAEIAPPRLRGGMGSIFQLGVTVGILYAYIVGIPLGSDKTSGQGWREMAVIGAILPIALFVVAFFIPRSPRWLLSKDRVREAEAVLRLLRGPDYDIDHEKQETIDALKQSAEEGSAGIADLFRGTAGKAMVVGGGADDLPAVFGHQCRYFLLDEDLQGRRNRRCYYRIYDRGLHPDSHHSNILCDN